MSNEEQDAVILRLARRRGECKKRIALLESELRAAGRSLYEIGGDLRDVTPVGTSSKTPKWILPQVTKAPDICALPRIEAMLVELETTQSTLSQLNRSAIDLGID